MVKHFLFTFLAFIGCSAYAQWHTINTSLTDIPITDIFFVNNNVGYATTSTYAVLKTTNGGASWEEKHIEAGYLTAAYFFDEQKGYVVTTSLVHDHLFYKTEDGGNSWTKLTSSLPLPFGGNAITFTDANTGFIAGGFDTVAYLCKTTDGGNTWSLKGNFTIPVVSVYFLDANNGFCGDESGNIFRTADAGETWTLVSVAVTADVIQSFSFPTATTGYAVGETNGHVFKTTDAGVTWTEANQIYPSSIGTDLLFIDENVGYITCFDYNEPYEMLKTTNGGSTWVFDNTYNEQYRGGCISKRPDGVLFIGTLEGKILSSAVLSSLSEQATAASGSLFPVPSSGQLTVSLNNQITEASLLITDLTGQVVVRKLVQQQQQLQLQLRAGMYQYAFETADGVSAFSKLVIVE